MEIATTPQFKISKELLISKSKKIIPKFKYTEHVKYLYSIICEYINKDSAFENRILKTTKGDIPFSLQKGLFLISPPGAGKSFIFEQLLLKFRKYRVMNVYEIQNLYLEQGYNAINHYNNSIYTRSNESKTIYNLYIDDFGRESANIKYYGNDIAFMDILLDLRSRMFVKYGVVTHGSSNLDLIKLKEHYNNPATFSRMFQLFNFIIFNNNEDFRMM